MSKHHVIYIPGIGDNKPYYQPQLINFWRFYGIKVHYHPVIWRSQDEDWTSKLNKISKLIDELYQQGFRVSLVGVSAGASAALNAYAADKRKIRGIVYICGKLKHPETISKRYYQRNPAFKSSLAEAQLNIEKLSDEDKSKMLNLRPLYDQTVPVSHTEISGVRRLRMLSVYHVPSIFIAITLYGPLIAKFIRRKDE